jgi:uncharacterized membrane protein
MENGPNGSQADSASRGSAAETPLQRSLYRWALALYAAGLLTALVLVYRDSGMVGLTKLWGSATLSFVLVGKFIVFAGLHADSFPPFGLALMVWAVDLACAFFLASGLSTLERLPRLGDWMRRMRAKALEVLGRYPGLRRMAFWGVAAYVFLPLAGTGAITGSFAARIVGLSRAEGVLAIAIGSACTAFAFALLALALGEGAQELVQSPLLLGSLILLLAVLGWVAWRRVLAKLRQG